MTAPWIIKNKGVRPWPFTKQLPKYGYRNNPRWVSLEGNRVIKNSPVWPMDEGKMTAVDASKHIPCGYWFDGPDIPPVGIGYTTPQMPAGGIQTLTPVDSNGNPVPRPSSCRWVVLSGGGSVTQNGVYTAPATNPGCANNATIGLVCDGVVVDSVQIAINAWWQNNTAYDVHEFVSYINGQPGNYRSNNDANCIGRHIVYRYTSYYCDGTLRLTGENFCVRNDGASSGAAGDNCCTLGQHDLRTQAMITGGCCPAPLM